MVTDGIKDLRGNVGIAPQYVIAGRGMGFDQRALLGVEAPGLVEDRERDLGLADVMKHRSRVQSLDVPLRHAETEAEIDRYSRHQKAVLIGSFVVAANGLEPARQAVLGDVVGDAASCALRAPDVDGFAAQHRGEHRPDGDRTRWRGLTGTVESVVRAVWRGLRSASWASKFAGLIGSIKHARRAQRIGLDDEQALFLIDQENPVAYVPNFRKHFSQSRYIFDDRKSAVTTTASASLRRLPWRRSAVRM